MEAAPTLVCFALKEEAAKFLEPTLRSGRCERVISGMGLDNAARAIRKALAGPKPRLVVTSGFAGGLNPELPLGSIIFDVDSELEASLGARLLDAGAVPGKFHCAECIAVTAAEKQVLWQLTGADAVEMESAVIRKICAEKKIPSATVRVISDAAHEDLPLDFNALTTRDKKMNFAKLAGQLLLHPGKIPELLHFRKQTIHAAEKLGETLRKSLTDF